MKELLARIENEGLLTMSQEELNRWKRGKAPGYESAGEWAFYPSSCYTSGGILHTIIRSLEGKALLLLSREKISSPFDGAEEQIGELHTSVVQCSTENATKLQKLFPWTRPVSLRERRTTIGLGDRLGRATAGHIRAVRKYDCSPVLAQQSIRELEFTGRTFADVVADASWMVFQEGYEEGYGADGDHLKNIPSIKSALKEQMPMVTLDLTEVMKPEVADWSSEKVDGAFAELPAALQRRIEKEYFGSELAAGSQRIVLDRETAKRCAVMYGSALDLAVEVDQYLRGQRGDAYDLEISIDETSTPTLPEHHAFIARELQLRTVTVNSVAPRFIGEFQKAIDYIGDLDEFERQFKVHCEIARAYGGYKISVHSGSDKLSAYPAVGRGTALRLHLKTSGTSWLEALRVIAEKEPALYRKLHSRALEHYPEALKYYHITADLSKIAPLERTSDRELPSYLDHPDCRQMLHISYGGILSTQELADQLFAALHLHEERYNELLIGHFTRHLEALGVPRKG
ncbi:MAG: tagaturonate epimerase family protein [Alkalispirochaetaceae bacterium]